MISWKRTLRTPHSERLVAYRDGVECAGIDLHFSAGGKVVGTVVLLTPPVGGAAGRSERPDWTEEQIADLLTALDEDFLPAVDLAKGNLTYTVFRGELMGAFEAHGDEAPV